MSATALRRPPGFSRFACARHAGPADFPTSGSAIWLVLSALLRGRAPVIGAAAAGGFGSAIPWKWTARAVATAKGNSPDEYRWNAYHLFVIGILGGRPPASMRIGFRLLVCGVTIIRNSPDLSCPAYCWLYSGRRSCNSGFADEGRWRWLIFCGFRAGHVLEIQCLS